MTFLENKMDLFTEMIKFGGSEVNCERLNIKS